MPDEQAVTKRRLMWLVGFLVVIVILSRLGGSKSSSSQGTTTAAAPTADTAPAKPKGPSVWDVGAVFHTTKGQPACLTGKAYVEMMQYVQAKDEGAMEELFNSGSCAMVKGGLAVTPKQRPKDLGMFEGQGLIEARIVGHRQTMVLDRRLLQEHPE